MIEHLTWTQTANIAWIAAAGSAGWHIGRAVTELAMVALMQRAERWIGDL